MVPAECPQCSIGWSSDHVHRQGTNCRAIHLCPELYTGSWGGGELLAGDTGSVTGYSWCTCFNEQISSCNTEFIRILYCQTINLYILSTVCNFEVLNFWESYNTNFILLVFIYLWQSWKYISHKINIKHESYQITFCWHRVYQPWKHFHWSREYQVYQPVKTQWLSWQNILEVCAQ